MELCVRDHPSAQGWRTFGGLEAVKKLIVLLALVPFLVACAGDDDASDDNGGKVAIDSEACRAAVEDGVRDNSKPIADEEARYDSAYRDCMRAKGYKL